MQVLAQKRFEKSIRLYQTYQPLEQQQNQGQGWVEEDRHNMSDESFRGKYLSNAKEANVTSGFPYVANNAD